ncbi:MAG: HDOD domain-containing protein [Acidimicrobiales bacterium]
MTKVLFVDDEPQVLSGLRRMLRPRARDWELSFAGSGPDALAAIDASPVDVVVTDMRMPGMDGATLLAELQERHPEIVRIVLSGHSEMGMALRSSQVAHQFLTKPCDADLLTSTVERACQLQGTLRSPVLRGVVGELTSLPSPPQVVLELRRLLSSDEPSLDRVAELIGTDPGLSAKLLQLVNSAFFGLGKRLTSVREAVSYLGINVLSNLAVAMSAFDRFTEGAANPAFLMAEQAHALRMSGLVRDLVPTGRVGHDAFVVGLLHDVGILVLSSAVPDEHQRARALAIDEGLPLTDAELAVFGTSHAEVGAYLLSLWGLPAEVLEAVANHHRAPELGHRTMDLVHAAYIAEMLDAAHSGRPRFGGAPVAEIDPDYLDQLGVTERIAELRGR